MQKIWVSSGKELEDPCPLGGEMLIPSRNGDLPRARHRAGDLTCTSCPERVPPFFFKGLFIFERQRERERA